MIAVLISCPPCKIQAEINPEHPPDPSYVRFECFSCDGSDWKSVAVFFVPLIPYDLI